ncbi:MAG: hypothetical protein HUU35_12275, partial [Armatimonadetes bacterium]|nr:hypothetical protein [Armatimonadota bacterium]
DTVELRNVRPRAGLKPGDLAALGKPRPTGTERMLSSGRILPVQGFGPFALPLDGAGFPPEATVSLTANLLQGYASGP